MSEYLDIPTLYGSDVFGEKEMRERGQSKRARRITRTGFSR